MRYGAVPVVSRTGGLSDTIIDANTAGIARSAATGVQFAPATQDMLEDAIRRTCALYRDPDSWRRVQLNAMASDSSWRVSAADYASLFRKLSARSAPNRANDVAKKGAASGGEPRSFAPIDGAGLPDGPGRGSPQTASPVRRAMPRKASVRSAAKP
jgi:starch synthase